MKKDEKASVSAIKIIAISIIFLLCSGIVVGATNIDIANVKIQFSNNYELNVLTTKTKVKEILEDNHIILADYETVKPGLNEEVGTDKIIKIIKSSEVQGIEEAQAVTNLEDIITTYGVITEEIITIEEEIPFETITKDAAGSEDGTTRVIKEGQNGLREVTYKITYRDAEEIAREELSANVIKEPVDKIVQVNTKQTSRSEVARTSPGNSATASMLQAKISGIEPKVVTLNTSAYTASTCGKKPTDPGYGVTASGFPQIPVDYGYRDSKYFWYTKFRRPIAEPIPASKGISLDTVKYAASRLDPDVKFTDEACKKLVKVPRVFLNTVSSRPRRSRRHS